MVLWLGASLAMATGVDTYLVTSTRAGKFTNVQYRLYIRCSGCTQPLHVQGLASLPMYNTGYISDAVGVPSPCMYKGWQVYQCTIQVIYISDTVGVPSPCSNTSP